MFRTGWSCLRFPRPSTTAKLTHINIAFENPTNDLGDLSFSRRNEVLIAKAKANQVKILISIGGGAASGNKVLLQRYFDLLTDARRSAFVGKISDYLARHDFDGLDVDIEGRQSTRIMERLSGTWRLP